jgi:hypothetical protein
LYAVLETTCCLEKNFSPSLTPWWLHEDEFAAAPIFVWITKELGVDLKNAT